MDISCQVPGVGQDLLDAGRESRPVPWSKGEARATLLGDVPDPAHVGRHERCAAGQRLDDHGGEGLGAPAKGSTSNLALRMMAMTSSSPTQSWMTQFLKVVLGAPLV